MSDKIGVYICKGCGIGEALDIDALAEAAEEEGAAVKSHDVACSEEGINFIKGDIESEETGKVIIAACSPRVKYEVFDFPGALLERANIREHCVWSHPADDEDTQMMAEDIIRMSVAKMQKANVPEPYKPEEELSTDVLVVGGGVTGMNAALEGAKAGYKVHLVEKEENLGGFWNKMYKALSLPFKDLTEVDVDALVSEINANDNIAVYTGATLKKTAGGPGLFEATVSQNGNSSNVRCGAIIQATGWKPYEPEKLDHLGYGKSPDIITNVMMEEMAKAGKITRSSDGAPAKNVVFVQCAGSRDPEHLPYCSTVCCLVSMKQATYLKEQDPETQVYVIYKDIRTPGQSEDFYRKAQKDGVVFIRGEVQDVKADGGKIQVETTDVLLNDHIQIEDVDLMVLATGMVPSTLPDADTEVVMPPTSAEEDEEEKPVEVTSDSGFGKTPALNLEYRQGPELPHLKHGFPDSHFICFPYESRRTGIYAAGCVRSPMNMTQAKEDGAGAALKAIQAGEVTAVGSSTFPRYGDLTYPDFFMQRCTQCKRCTEECPFGAINEDEKANPLPNPTRCRRCGTCMGACPERIISFKNYSVDMVGTMIKAMEVPDEDEEKPRVLVLVCENDAYPALDMAGIDRMQFSPFVRFIPMRCLGSLNLVWIADSLSRGIDGILLLGCRKGEDYQCHFIKGSELADTRLSKVSETLDRLALESERVRIEEVSIMDYAKIPGIIDDFMETIEEVGPNPYKGF